VRRLSELRSDSRGATAVEYGLIMALVFLAMIAGVRAFAAETIELWTYVSDEVSG
jgi:pilus assembly protein Flp/PilA